MARSANTSGKAALRAPESEHYLLFEMKQYADAKSWSLVKSTVIIDGGEPVEFQPGAARVGGITVIAAALLVLQHRAAQGKNPIIDARESRWERALAKKVYQAMQDANKPKGNTPHYLHRAFGATTSDGEERPSIIKILMATGGKTVHYQHTVEPSKLRLECLMNGAPFSDSQRSALLDSVCGMPAHMSGAGSSDGEQSAPALVRGALISGVWNCESTVLKAAGKLPRKIPWSLEMSLDSENQIHGTSWYQSPAPGANGRQVTGSVKGEFIAEGGYLRIEWWVSDPNALGFGYHVLRLRSDGRSMEGYGIGHSSEGDGMFAVATTCARAPDTRESRISKR